MAQAVVKWRRFYIFTVNIKGGKDHVPRAVSKFNETVFLTILKALRDLSKERERESWNLWAPSRLKQMSHLASYVGRSFIKNWQTPASFSFIFSLFKQTMKFLQQINVKKCPSSIQHLDLNPWPLERETSPITTRPGLLVHLSKPHVYIK